jgi:hypothetical protein
MKHITDKLRKERAKSQSFEAPELIVPAMPPSSVSGHIDAQSGAPPFRQSPRRSVLKHLVSKSIGKLQTNHGMIRRNWHLANGEPVASQLDQFSLEKRISTMLTDRYASAPLEPNRLDKISPAVTQPIEALNSFRSPVRT